MIPFSPTHIEQDIIADNIDDLKSEWINTRPRTKQFVKTLSAFIGNRNTLCLNSATALLEVILRRFGVGPGDEVIVPAYTYSAIANRLM